VSDAPLIVDVVMGAVCGFGVLADLWAFWLLARVLRDV
jgi:hypothetical protein